MWLLLKEIWEAMESAIQAGTTPTMKQQADYEARVYSETGTSSPLLTVAGDTAQITVQGVLTKAPDLMAYLFGGGNVTYPDIIRALAEADADPAVKRAEMVIDSPGGHIDGMFDTLAAMGSFSKPLKAVVKNKAASAAYALASQADEIIAANNATRFGSIGIVASFRTGDGSVDITSTKAPKKRPDPLTEEGKAAIREELDALHEIFVDAIAAGRATDVDTVNADFGQGATLLAEEALKRGMIDAIAEAPLRVVASSQNSTTATSGGDSPETGPMDLKTLQAQHPDVYAAAVQEGVASERDRVTAHVVMGENSGALDVALGAIRDGSEMTATLQAQYLTAGMNRNDQNNRQDDDAQASGADGAAADENDPEAEASQVLDLVEARLGITGEV